MQEHIGKEQEDGIHFYYKKREVGYICIKKFVA